jgi:YD repeat-containing protein
MDATSYTYDANGNLLTKSGEATYTWDPENHLVKVQKADGTKIVTVYDADGIRTQTATTDPDGNVKTVKYLTDAANPLSHVVAETAADGTLQAYYVRGDDLLAVIRPLVPSPMGASDWQTRFVHADGVGSIRRLTDESGAISDGYSFTAFGE